MKITKINHENLNKVFKLDNKIFDYDKYNFKTFEEIQLDDKYIGLCVEINNIVIGYILTYNIFDEGCIIKIAIDDSFKRKGIATILFNEAKQLLIEKGVKNIYLEVSSKNISAIEFYKKLGFLTESIRKSYYNNGDDALIMWLRDI